MTQPDKQAIENVFRHLDRQVWIVTAASGDRRGGLLATWVSRASLDSDRPIILAGIAPNHYTAELIDASGTMAAHLLTTDQVDLAMNFTIGSGRQRDKLAGLSISTATTGSPILAECLAWLDCRIMARLDGGDRIYYWADVVQGHTQQEGPPLCESQLIAAASDEQKSLLLADRDADIELQRPLAEQWRATLPSYLQPRPPQTT